MTTEEAIRVVKGFSQELLAYKLGGEFAHAAVGFAGCVPVGDQSVGQAIPHQKARDHGQKNDNGRNDEPFFIPFFHDCAVFRAVYT